MKATTKVRRVGALFSGAVFMVGIALWPATLSHAADQMKGAQHLTKISTPADAGTPPKGSVLTIDTHGMPHLCH